MRALILAGGLGTRLAGVVKDVPKPMAPVAGRPFLTWQIEELARQGIRDIVLCTGHLHEVVEKYFGDGSQQDVKIRYSIEREPLGTGGAIRQALTMFPGDERTLVLNGDTFVPLPYAVFEQCHSAAGKGFSVALVLRNEGDRYGQVQIADDGTIAAFLEKGAIKHEGYINAGVYLLDPGFVKTLPGAERFSFEREVLENPAITKYGVPFPGPFIDIGIPDDYEKAQDSIPAWSGKNRSKAAFLDRDGIIIRDTTYPHLPEHLQWMPGIVPLLQTLQDRGYKLCIMTNQAGIAKRKFTVEQHHSFNELVVAGLKNQGITIEGTWYCPFHRDGVLSEFSRDSLFRKPEPGMFLQAAEERFLALERSFMIGDNDSDRISLPYLASFVVKGVYPVREPYSTSLDGVLEQVSQWEKS